MMGDTLRNLMDEGLPLGGVLVLDAHVHLFEAPEGLAALADRVGIDKMALQVQCIAGSGQDEYFRALQQYPDYFIGLASTVNPWLPEEIIPRLEYLFNKGCIALGEQGPSYFNYPITGPNYEPMWEFARRKSCFVTVHSDHNNYPTAAPLEVAKVAKRHPEIPIGITHVGIDTPEGLEESIEAAKQCDNIFLEISSIHVRYGAFEKLIDQVGADRVVFGSDIGAIHVCCDLANVVYAKVSDDSKENVLGLNLARLLKVEPEQLRRKRGGP